MSNNPEYRNGKIIFDGIDICDAASEFNTPAYIYSRKMIEDNWLEYDLAFGGYKHLVCYAVKANSSLAVLNIMAKLGAGFDIVSLGELERVIAAGGDPKKILFSGVGKSYTEIKRALELGIKCINIESEAELERVNAIAIEMNLRAPISLRVNPDVDPKTHPYVSTGLKQSKFGVDIDLAFSVYKRAAQMDGIAITGIDCHIGSQLTDDSPYFDALKRVMNLYSKLTAEGIEISHIDMGGGIGICYQDESIPNIKIYIEKMVAMVEESGAELIIEPGRSIVGNAGLLLTKVEYIKKGDEKSFAIVDAAMNDLMRPSLYSSWQNIIPATETDADEDTYDIVGPVCESGDFLGKDRKLRIKQGDILAVCSAGAYGFSMSSNYNSRPRAVELMIDNNSVRVIRKRETVAELFANETIID
ncbi:MAG: diaminopimelate decarboxylase [Gammaproteobacteria bacterium]|nr:MAG: diaminopimelate decarboxylase [Gammaproteobacteria bacterium]